MFFRFWSTNEDEQLFTDRASGEGLGFGIYCAGKWVSERWQETWHTKGYTKDITVLVHFPIVVVLFIWGDTLKNKKLKFMCDNSSVCHILNKMSSKSEMVMVLLRNLTIKCLQQNIVVKAEHVSGANNSITDALSRFQIHRFRELAPTADQEPYKMPTQLWKIFETELLT